VTHAQRQCQSDDEISHDYSLASSYVSKTVEKVTDS